METLLVHILTYGVSLNSERYRKAFYLAIQEIESGSVYGNKSRCCICGGDQAEQYGGTGSQYRRYVCQREDCRRLRDSSPLESWFGGLGNEEIIAVISNRRHWKRMQARAAIDRPPMEDPYIRQRKVEKSEVFKEWEASQLDVYLSCRIKERISNFARNLREESARERSHLRALGLGPKTEQKLLASLCEADLFDPRKR